MPYLAKNIIAIITGLVVGGAVNMSIVLLSGSVIAPPEGVDVTTTEGLMEGMHLFGPQHFIMPFLAHAIGTLVGAYLAARIVPKRKLFFAMVIGLVFLFGGVLSSFMLPAPTWFIVLDLVIAYLPMAWLGWRIAKKKAPTT